jgi:hypothetical protein
MFTDIKTCKWENDVQSLGEISHRTNYKQKYILCRKTSTRLRTRIRIMDVYWQNPGATSHSYIHRYAHDTQ